MELKDHDRHGQRDGSSRATPVRLAVDIGGTFTDIVLEVDRHLLTRKVLTTASEPGRGVIEGARTVLRDAGLRFADIDIFVHGTTLATNAVLERRGARTALIATGGFRDVLEIATEGRFDQYDLQIEKRPSLVPRSLRLTVPERLNAQGQVLLALDREAMTRHIAFLRRHEVESVAICFLHSYVNGEHEQQASEILSAALPGLSISISSEVCPEIREFERTSTTVANAYVQPRMADYLGRMRSQLTAEGFRGVLYLVTSNGDLTSLETARRFPVRLIESGPAGGAIFAADIAARADERAVLAFDMGGTTAKLCLIQNAVPDRDRVYEVDRAARFQKGSGLPLRIPVIDLVEIGAGGGSIAGVNTLQSVTVGPHSAGSEPGPVCYGRGGSLPTVTDADAVLGMIDPAAFAGGTVQLDLDAAHAALEHHVGTPLGMSSDMAAYAVHEMVCESMASAARAHAIEKGQRVADHTLIAFGGAAPLHVARVAEKIGIERILIPPHAGVGSAIGFLRAPISYEIVRSRHMLLDSLAIEEISDLLDEMHCEACAIVAEGARGAPLETRRVAFMRYVGQGHEIPVHIPDRRLRAADRNALLDEFESAYVRLFNRTIPGGPKEILSWSVIVSTGIAPAHSQAPDAANGAAGSAAGSAANDAKASPSGAPVGQRRYFDGKSGEPIDVAIYRREALRLGTVVDGPALIAENETTTFVSASFSARLDGQGNILMQRKHSTGASL